MLSGVISKSWHQEYLFLRTAFMALVINLAILKAKDIDITFPIILANCLAGKNFNDYILLNWHCKDVIFLSGPNWEVNFEGIHLHFCMLVTTSLLEININHFAHLVCFYLPFNCYFTIIDVHYSPNPLTTSMLDKGHCYRPKGELNQDSQ